MVLKKEYSLSDLAIEVVSVTRLEEMHSIMNSSYAVSTWRSFCFHGLVSRHCLIWVSGYSVSHTYSYFCACATSDFKPANWCVITEDTNYWHNTAIFPTNLRARHLSSPCGIEAVIVSR